MALDEPVTLYHLAPSHHCEKARKVLDLKGIPYEIVDVPYQDHWRVLKHTDQDYTPYVELADGSGIAWDGIVDWAEDTVPEPTLFPGDDPAHTRAVSRVIEHWAHTMVEDVTWKYSVPDAPEQFDDEDERWRFVEFQERKWGELETMHMRRPEFLDGVRQVCQLAEDVLDGRDFLLGDEPSLADLAVYGGLHPLYFVGKGVPKEFEALAAWRERVDAL